MTVRDVDDFILISYLIDTIFDANATIYKSFKNDSSIVALER